MVRNLVHVLIGLLLLGAVALGGLWAAQEDTHVNTAVVIDGSLSDVWSVLGDPDRFPEWNPLIKELKGDFRRGGRIHVVLDIPGEGLRTYDAILKGYEVEHEYIWEYDFPIPRLFTGKHKLIIDPAPGGGVRLRHEEEFRGLLVGPLTASYLEKKRRGFEAMNKALKARVEGGG